ncbi:MAG: hypothetical protein CL424_09485 [Acidimicrobiaceae bacterium]|nr:hypothetical protein [Acidimicrobiaceae bacterium]
MFRQVRSRIFVPIVFYTALPELASDCGLPPFVQVVSKNTGDEVDALREAVNLALHSTFQQLRARFDQHIEHVKRDFMIDFVEQHWDELHQEQRRSDVAHLLVRRLAASLEGGASLFADLLEGTEPAEVGALVHPMRYYIVPPLDDRRTGDVLVFHEVDANGEPAEEWYVVLTPSCDFVPTRLKADHTVMVACDLLEDTKEYKEWSEAGDDGKESARKKVESIMRNNRFKSQSERFHFLPAAWDVPNLVVDFQRWRHITTATLDGAERVATIDSPFVEALVSRFTRYFNRVGTPDLDVNVAIDRLT